MRRRVRLGALAALAAVLGTSLGLCTSAVGQTESGSIRESVRSELLPDVLHVGATHSKRTGTIVVQVCSSGGPAPGGTYCHEGGAIYIARLGRNGEAGKRTLTRQSRIHVAPGGYEVGLYETIDAVGPGGREEKHHRYGNAKIVTVRGGQLVEVMLEGAPIP